mgnify:CR=1 FL=1
MDSAERILNRINTHLAAGAGEQLEVGADSVQLLSGEEHDPHPLIENELCPRSVSHW